MPSCSQFRAGVFQSALACLTLAVGCAQSAQAQVLTVDDSSNNLGTVNISTGAVTVIGNMGNDVMTDIAYSSTGILYGTSFNNLYRINAATAAVTLLGSTGVAGANALVFGPDGTLYLASGTSQQLFTVNTATGSATLLGTIGFASAGDLAFNGGSLYMSSTTNQLIRINLAGSVSGTAVGSFGFTNVFGLATANNGVLYGVANTQVFSVNTATGQGTLVRDYGASGLGNANGTSFITEAIMPEPGSLALFVGLGVSGAGFLARRKQARRAA